MLRPDSESKEPKKPGESLIGPLKDQIALIALLVTLAGLASTEAYYARFNVQYQFLSLPATHIVYRGIGVALSRPYVSIPYVIASGWILLVSSGRLLTRSQRFELPLTYVVIFLSTISTYLIARVAGTQQADADRVEQTCTLPRVMAAEIKDMPDIDIGQKLRLLTIDANYVIVFKPVNDATARIPLVKRISKDAVRTLETAP